MLNRVVLLNEENGKRIFLGLKLDLPVRSTDVRRPMLLARHLYSFASLLFYVETKRKSGIVIQTREDYPSHVSFLFN